MVSEVTKLHQSVSVSVEALLRMEWTLLMIMTSQQIQSSGHSVTLAKAHSLTIT